MSRFHAALDSARALAIRSGRPVRSPPPLPGAVEAADLPLLRLWQAVEARLPACRCKVVQIAACAAGEDDPAVAVRLARLAGRTLGGGVVVLNGTPAVEGEGRGTVVFGPLPGQRGDPRALDRRLLAAYWRHLRERAELVVVATPPVLESPLALAVAPTVDGVVLVVEAERTRVAVARAARDTLAAGGANLLGVVLNKRRYPVPVALYEIL